MRMYRRTGKNDRSAPWRSLQPIGDDLPGELNEPTVTKLNQPDVACFGERYRGDHRRHRPMH